MRLRLATPGPLTGMRLEAHLHRRLALLAVLAGGGLFGGALAGISHVDRTLGQAVTTQQQAPLVRVSQERRVDGRDCPAHHGGRTEHTRAL